MSKRTLFLVGGITAILVIVVFCLVKFPKEKPLGLETHEFTKFETDVVGTRVVTTTIGVGFSITGTGGISATTSYITKIDGSKTNAIYTLMPTHASSSAKLQFDIWGSNDAYCDTTTSTAGNSTNIPLMSEIYWFSAGDHVENRTHLVDLLNNSSSAYFNWANPTSTMAAQILLTNLNYECLKFDVAGSSTVLYAGIRTRADY